MAAGLLKVTGAPVLPKIGNRAVTAESRGVRAGRHRGGRAVGRAAASHFWQHFASIPQKRVRFGNFLQIVRNLARFFEGSFSALFLTRATRAEVVDDLESSIEKMIL